MKCNTTPDTARDATPVLFAIDKQQKSMLYFRRGNEILD